VLERKVRPGRRGKGKGERGKKEVPEKGRSGDGKLRGEGYSLIACKKALLEKSHRPPSP
jgi:hypothetical protein